MGTYYFKLPFYLKNGNSTKNVEIKFDGQTVLTAEISSTDINHPNEITFSLDKEPGNYNLEVIPQTAGIYDSDLCLNDVWISNNNVDYYSILINYSRNIIKNFVSSGSYALNVEGADSIDYGFHPATGATMFADSKFVVEIKLFDSENFGKLYKDKDLLRLETYLATLKLDPSADSTLISDIELALSLFKARGYN